MLSITNIHWDHKPFTHSQDLVNILGKRLLAFKISMNLSVVGNDLVFTNLENGKIFKSSVYNKRYMKPGDLRIKAKGRKYLESEQPTKKQYEGFFSTVQNTLTELGLNADIVLQTKKESIVLRKLKTIYDRIPEVKSFPVEN